MNSEPLHSTIVESLDLVGSAGGAGIVTVLDGSQDEAWGGGGGTTNGTAGENR